MTDGGAFYHWWELRVDDMIIFKLCEDLSSLDHWLPLEVLSVNHFEFGGHKKKLKLLGGLLFLWN